jgi:hypothetical protein
LGSPDRDHDWIEMIASALVSKRRRDCLHQTPIEAQPPQSGGAGSQARGEMMPVKEVIHDCPIKALHRALQARLSPGS